MLKDLAKQGNKKTTKKADDKGKKVAKKVQGSQEQDNLDELVKVQSIKKNTIAKNTQKQYQFEEKDIAKQVVIPQIKKQQIKLTSWVPQSEQAAIDYGKSFNLNEHIGEFESLTNPDLNKQAQELLAKEGPKEVINESKEGIRTTVLAKTAQELKMEQSENDGLVFSKKAQDGMRFGPTNVPETKLNFTNQRLKDNNEVSQLKVKPLQKTRQQIREEEMEARMAEEKAKRGEIASQKWTGSTINRTREEPKQIIIRDTPMTFINSNTNTGQKEEIGTKFAELVVSKQSRRMMDDDDNVKYVSKAQMQQNKRKREEKEALLAEQALKNAK